MNPTQTIMTTDAKSLSPPSPPGDADGPSQRSITSEPAGLAKIRRNVQEFRDFFGDEDLDALQDLGREYHREVEQRRIAFKARVITIRRMLLGTFLFMVLLLLASISFFTRVGGLSIRDAILFSLYTITTAGFGSVDIPFTNGFLLFVILFLYVGIATLVILVALIYQFIALETARAKKSHDTSKLLRHGLDQLRTLHVDQTHTDAAQTIQKLEERQKTPGIQNAILDAIQTAKNFYRKNEINRVLSVLLYLIGLLMVGVIAMIKLQGWNFIQAFYFSTYVMTTVGYGDIAPTNNAAIWFTIGWILFNVSFVSIYMGNLSRYYMKICNANTARIERNMRQHQRSRLLLKQQTNDNTDKNDTLHSQTSGPKTIRTMKDVLWFVLHNLSIEDRSSRERQDDNDEMDQALLAELLSLKSRWETSDLFKANQSRQPSFALLILVQERFANIIATEIAGSRSGFFVKDTTISVSFDSVQEVAEKWMIPTGAQEAFRAASFEALIHVGEHKLVTQGAEPLLALSPFAFFDIFSHLLSAMTDAGTMEGWLARTEELASMYFPRTHAFA